MCEGSIFDKRLFCQKSMPYMGVHLAKMQTSTRPTLLSILYLTPGKSMCPNQHCKGFVSAHAMEHSFVTKCSQTRYLLRKCNKRSPVLCKQVQGFVVSHGRLAAIHLWIDAMGQ